ncbi:carboxymuconolactone decarboxylase family protein [Paenibacillus albidus]|uniref:carboxymuconolactone decarboxylase family protein n=1 Tax=Paenibacillus albidus TaxID=2041023 RepID=UPI001BE5E64E|nr:carboxymuconolactone decarboxylase family protein [Paenibacillus albidus]MBT2293551.1 carboxymuconolactone decarboxylase family protein [Paenibacillus albidus]
MSLRFNYTKANGAAFRAMMALEEYAGSHVTDKVLYELIKLRASQINGCAYCLDMHAKDMLKLGDHSDRILLLSVWREVPHLYTDKERAVIELTEAVTQISHHGVPDVLYHKVREFVSESEYMDLIMAINTINSWNRIAISTGMFPGCFDAK